MSHLEKYECAELVLKFWGALDRNAYGEVLALIAPDCRWLRAGRWREGARDIEAALVERPKDLVVRHAIVNTVITLDGDTADCSFLLVAFSNRSAPGEALPLSTGGPKLVVDYRAACVKLEGVWKVKELSGSQVFKAP